jgi:hypothetical protein
MTAFAFLPLPAASSARTMPKIDTALPVFKPRWWFRKDRLDARPVVWSLLNRPDDWIWSSSAHCVIVHKPSLHEFWVGNGRESYRLYRADCGCSSEGGHFQHFQQGIFHRAFLSWQERQTPRLNAEHFAAHFVR